MSFTMADGSIVDDRVEVAQVVDQRCGLFRARNGRCMT
jgi:hypothetical protein